MCWTALRTSDSSEGETAASPLKLQLKRKNRIITRLVVIMIGNLVAAARSTNLRFLTLGPVDFVLNLRAIAEKPGACAQSSSNECYGQIVSPKKNRRRHQE